MGSNQRVIRITGTSATAFYMPVNRYSEDMSIQVDAGGSTFTVDYTLDNIIRSRASSYDVVTDLSLVAPASAQWSNLIASGAVDVEADTELQCYALRLNVTAYVGDVVMKVAQY